MRFGARLDATAARDASRYQLQSWNYRRTSSYGSGHFKRDGSAGHDRSNVAAHLSADGRSVLLVVPEMRPVMQMQLDYDLRSATRECRSRTRSTSRVQSVDPLDLRAAGFGALDWRASARRAAARHEDHRVGGFGRAGRARRSALGVPRLPFDRRHDGG